MPKGKNNGQNNEQNNIQENVQDNVQDAPQDNRRPVERYTKEKFIELAQNQGWVFLNQGTRNGSDQYVLEMLYDEAVKRNDPMLDSIMNRILTTNIWEMGDRNVLINQFDAELSSRDNVGNNGKIRKSMMPEYDEEDVEVYADALREEREQKGATDGLPKKIGRVIEPAPESPYYKNLVLPNGKKDPVSSDYVSYYHQWNVECGGNASPLMVYDSQKGTHHYSDLLKKNSASIRTGALRPNADWEGFLPEQEQVVVANGHVVMNRILINREQITLAKEALQEAKKGWLAVGAEQPDTPDGALIKRFCEDNAFLADPDQGNYLEAKQHNMYMCQSVQLIASSPKFFSNSKTFEETLAGMKGQAPEQQQLPEHLRKDILKDYMDLRHYAANELRVEYHRQQMALDGWDDQKEATYQAELKAAHKNTIDAFYKQLAVKDAGQYDAYMDNSFDHDLGKTESNRRDFFVAIGAMEGELQAMEMGWRSDEFLLLQAIGSIDADLRKRSMELRYGECVDQTAWDDLKVLEESFQALKDSVWNRKVSTPQDKKAVMDAFEDFLDLAEVVPDRFPLRSVNTVRSGLDKLTEKLGSQVPPLTPQEVQERQAKRTAAREALYARREELRTAHQPSDNERTGRLREYGKKARDKGWTEEFLEGLIHVANNREAMQIQLEKADELGIDEKEREMMREADRVMADALEKALESEIYSEEESKKVLQDIRTSLLPYRGELPAVDQIFGGLKKALDYSLSPLAKAQYADLQKKNQPAVTHEQAQQYAFQLKEVVKLLPDGAPEKAQIAQTADEINSLVFGEVVPGMKFDPTTGVMDPSYCYDFMKSVRRAEMQLWSCMNGKTPQTSPVLHMATDQMKLLGEMLREPVPMDKLRTHIALPGNKGLVCYADVKMPDQDQLRGKNPEEQKKILEDYEKKAAEDPEYFEVMQAGRDQVRIGIAYLQAKRNAEAEGKPFDDSKYRQQLKESTQKLSAAADRLLKKVNDPGFVWQDHPEMSGDSVVNINRQRGVAGIARSAQFQLRMLDLGVRIEDIGKIDHQTTLLSERLRPLDALQPLSPAVSNIRGKLSDIAALGDPKTDNEPNLRAAQELVYKWTRNLQREVQALVDAGTETRPEVVKELRNILGNCKNVLEDEAQDLYEALHALPADAVKIADKLNAYTRQNTPEAQRAVDRYLKELTVPDEPAMQGGKVVRVFSKEKTQLFKDLYTELGDRQLCDARAAAKAGAANPNNEQQVVPAEQENLDRVAGIQKLVTTALKASGAEVAGNTDAFLRSTQQAVYEKHRNEIAINEVNRDQFDTTEKRMDEADRILREQLEHVSPNARNDYHFFCISSQELREKAAEQDKHALSVAEYKSRLSKAVVTAKEYLDTFDKTLEVDEESDSTHFTNMRNALVTVTQLDDSKTPAQIGEAFETLRAASQNYFDKRNDFFHAWRDKGQNRLNMSADLIALANAGQNVLGMEKVAENGPNEMYKDAIRFVKPGESIASQISKAQAEYAERDKETTRRRIGLEKLQKEEHEVDRSKKMQRAKEALQHREAVEERRSLKAQEEEKDGPIRRSNTLK